MLLLATLVAAGHAVLNKRDPRAALGWAALIMLVPVIGVMAYLLLGINRTQRRARQQRAQQMAWADQSLLEPADIDSLRRPPQEGGHVKCFFDSREIVEVMRASVRRAKRQICLSVYIFESDGSGADFIHDLGEAVSRGVEVRVLLDGIGALYSRRNTRRELQRVGVQVGLFNPPRLIPPSWTLNLRNHRKMLLIDGELAYVGGTNLRNAYTAPEGRIADMNFALSGPVVKDIYQVFASDWARVTGEQLQGVSALPATEPANARCRVLIDGPDNDVDLLSLAFQEAIGQAQHRVRLLTPYFLPPRDVLAALQLAAVRGATVQVLLPARNNLIFVHWATRHMLWELLRFDIEVYYQGEVFDHSKLLIVDDTHCLIGSPNVDARSLRLNFEVSVAIESRAVVAQLHRQVEQRLVGATRVTAAGLQARSLPARLRDAIAWLFSPYL